VIDPVGDSRVVRLPRCRMGLMIHGAMAAIHVVHIMETGLALGSRAIRHGVRMVLTGTNYYDH
jgi:hypothetical protein